MWHRPPALAVAGSILIITCVTFGLPAVASGQGWYLMAPPPGDDGEPDAKRPLADWELMKSFDAARTCEVFQAKLVKRLEEMGKAEREDDRERRDVRGSARCDAFSRDTRAHQSAPGPLHPVE